MEAGATYWIAGLSVLELEGDGIGLPDGESFETGISRPVWQGLGGRSAQVRRDYIEFLWDVEQAYFDEMYRYIKEELGAHAPVSGTQVPWSPPGIQARLDYVDAHAYWNHPVFPGTPWDASDLYVVNNSMTSSANGGRLPRWRNPSGRQTIRRFGVQPSRADHVQFGGFPPHRGVRGVSRLGRPFRLRLVARCGLLAAADHQLL